MSDSPDQFHIIGYVWEFVLSIVATISAWTFDREVKRVDKLQEQMPLKADKDELVEKAGASDLERVENRLEHSLAEHRNETREGFTQIRNDTREGFNQIRSDLKQRLDDLMGAVQSGRKRRTP